MEPISFTVKATPCTWKRPVKAAGKRGMFTVASDLAHRRTVALYASQAIAEPFVGPVAVDLVFFLPIPASTTGQKRADMLAHRILPTLQKEDIDNLSKGVLDAMRAIAYKDDGQVVALTALKLYGEHPRTEVRVSSFDPELWD